MADRMHVTSVIGDPGRAMASPGQPLPIFGAGCGIFPRRRRLTCGAARSIPQPGRQPMSIPAALPQVLDFFGIPLVIEPSAGQLTSDAGLLPLREFDERIGLTRAFADALDDPRDPGLTEHPFLEMVRS